MRSSFALLIGLCASVAVAAACNDNGFVAGKGGETPTPGSSPTGTATVTVTPTASGSPSATPSASPSPVGGTGQLIVQAMPGALTSGKTGTLYGQLIDVASGTVLYTGTRGNVTFAMGVTTTVGLSGIVVPQTYFLRAWLDVNQNGVIDTGDAIDLGDLLTPVPAQPQPTYKPIFVSQVK